MHTFVDCIPCFYRQILTACRLTNIEESIIRQCMNETAEIIKNASFSLSPPELVGKITKTICNKIGTDDPFREIKIKSNRLALSFYDTAKSLVTNSTTPLLTATELAITGNIIDFGAKSNLSLEDEIVNIVTVSNKFNKHHFFAFDLFFEQLSQTRTILYLADNAGETVFDRILIEELISGGKKVIYAVKEKPALNDACLEDARVCGINKITTVISSGSVIPGTVLELSSPEFMDFYNKAEMIISKGQGNFESFVSHDTSVFYLFMAKCERIAGLTDSKIGDIHLRHNGIVKKERKEST